MEEGVTVKRKKKHRKKSMTCSFVFSYVSYTGLSLTQGRIFISTFHSKLSPSPPVLKEYGLCWKCQFTVEQSQP